MVMTFAVLLGLVFILEVAAGITAYVMSDTVKGFVKKQMIKGVEEYNNNTDVKKAWDTTQTRFKCCGVNAAGDWCTTNKTLDLPESCCNMATASVDVSKCTKNQCPVPDPVTIYTKGCLQQLSKWVEGNIYLIGGVGIGLAFVQIVGIILACCLARTIKKEYDVV
ncbi:hypothetical protein LSH36_430g01018 [Paralvinella palmiformis]|uniref:Tetraspanin n=1 Tax=Paralvinella palmiformis TaxID=53620 RepID=A0AAD9MZZ0_9ANNE|nr:hypothetical protein LSH36_430g01018 [Paralvinella palmiformis]